MPIMRQRAFHIAPGTENQIPITPTLYTANPQVYISTLNHKSNLSRPHRHYPCKIFFLRVIFTLENTLFSYNLTRACKYCAIFKNICVSKFGETVAKRNWYWEVRVTWCSNVFFYILQYTLVYTKKGKKLHNFVGQNLLPIHLDSVICVTTAMPASPSLLPPPL